METAEQLIRALRAPDQRGMGRIEASDNGPSNINRLADLDARATHIRVWDSTVIPGNLQTPGYSAAVIRAAHPRLSSIELERRVLRKEARARAFLRRTFDESMEQIWIIIGERAITQAVRLDDDGETHAKQLWHLQRLAAHARILVQVLPEGVVTPGLADQFCLHTLDAEHRVGYVETIMGSWYSTRLEDVAKLHSTFTEIGSAAMSPSATRTFIREVLATWRSAKITSLELTEESDSSSPRIPPRATTALESQDSLRAPHRTEP
jgi:hypothetical protein